MEVENFKEKKELPEFLTNKYFLIALVLVFEATIITIVSYIAYTQGKNAVDEVETTPTPTVKVATTPTPTINPDTTVSPTPMYDEIAPTITPATLPAESTTEPTEVDGQFRFTSPTNNVTFLFNETSNGDSIKVHEDGNKIYVYPDVEWAQEGDYSHGQYVEIFEKNASDSLESAIYTEFLWEQYLPENCTTSTDIVINSQSTTQENYQYATITVTGTPNGLEELSQMLENCPSPYTQSNGISYFMMDPELPTSYAFVSIGQSGIYSEGETPWQDSIEFIQ